jgi:hypothetical protein
MDLTLTARRGSAICASLAAGALLTLASPSMSHASGARDSDRDGLRNLGEFRHGTAPHRSDSDDDGIEDGPEVHDGCTATDPTDADTDGDGIEDGAEDTDGDGIDDAEDTTEDNCQGDEDVPGGSGGDGFVVHYVVR